ncbi:hypothetical protein GQ54DRAFT_283146 [Martensiomyces pterosporus]|nr:hypothetical protein GQ54DRAFT_283146 [Martensiomyces pterosporus]
MRALRTEIANARASGDQAGLAGTAAANSTAEWVLAKVLLPHHLLFVVQTAAHCSLEGSFVPRAVLRSMYAALYSGPRSQSTYFICLEAFAKRHALDPSDVPRISGLFEHIQKALANHHRIDARAGDQVQPTVYHKSRCMCLAAVRATLAQLKEHMLVCMGSQGDDCESLAYRIARRPTEEACIPHLLEGISAAGVENCILVAALCCTSHGSRAPWDRATRILRVYAKFLDATMKSSADRSMPFALPTGINGSDTISANELRQWAQEARSVFYEAVGYSGAASPMSPKDLSLRLVAASSDEALADTGANPKQLWRTRSGFWANIALLELLHGYYENNRESVGSGALDSAVAWLRCAFNYLGRDDAGSRAQIWMLLLRLRMAQAPLTHGDLAQMHADLAPDSDLLRLHASTPCFALVNHVLGTILRLAATTETLKAVRSYIASVAPTNTELTVRLIARASSMEGSRVDAAGVLKRAQYRNPSDPLLAEM